MILLLLLLTIITSKAYDLYPVIHLTSGQIRGRIVVNEATRTDIFYAFEGIPYAKPPLGKLRFKPPVRMISWVNIYNATKNPEMCMQLEGGSEDCLYLNVYTPHLPHKYLKELPVMVYIHGGGFIIGSMLSNYKGPEYFMKKRDKIVLVSIQYRLNVFGFLSTNNKYAEGNVGLKDQVAALKWVKLEISKFGGNPDKVTIFGQSAGGACVQYLMISPLARGLFHRAIAQSGSVLNRWALQRKPREKAFKLGLDLGIVANSSSKLIEELQKIHPAMLVKVACPLNTRDPLSAITFVPTIEKGSNAFITISSYRALKEGLYATDIPFLTGYNDNEASVFFELNDNVVNFIKLIIKIHPTLVVPISLNLKEHSEEFKLVQKEIKSHYFTRNTGIRDYLSEEFIVRGIRKSVDLMRNHSRVYIYKFCHDNLGHSSELRYLFFNKTNLYMLESPESVVIDRMVKLWINFATHGNPTPQFDVALNYVKWKYVLPGYNNVPFLNIKDDLTIEYNIDQESYEYWEQMFHIFGKPPFLTW